MPARGQQGRTGLRPEVWITGPDPVKHEKYIAWHRARAQAHYRGEAWNLTFEQWVDAWGNNWHRRGRHSDSLLLVRQDYRLPWAADNIELIDRQEFHRRQQLKIREKHNAAL